MRLYGDTSWWLACKCRGDFHHGSALKIFDRAEDVQIIWTPWHRVEVFNTIRQAERTGLVAKGESKQVTRLREQEVRFGYWPHTEFDWTNAVRTACEFGAEHSLRRIVRAMDLFHVAIAMETASDAFLTFDEDQGRLAEAVGLHWLRLH